MKNILIVIPARGDSKGIPRKNLRALNGKPLICYAIQTALNSRFPPDVYVSSDDDEILSLSQKIGAKTIRRDPQKAQDATTLDPVIYEPKLHELEFFLSRVIQGLNEFKSISDVIIANRHADVLDDVVNKVYIRNLFGND